MKDKIPDIPDNGVFNHLLTCSRRPDIVDQINSEIITLWEFCHQQNVTPPILNGATPKMTDSQIAFWLAASQAFKGRYLTPERQAQIRHIINEARQNLTNACKSHPIINQVRDRARNLQEEVTLGTPIIDEYLDGDIGDIDV